MTRDELYDFHLNLAADYAVYLAMGGQVRASFILSVPGFSRPIKVKHRHLIPNLETVLRKVAAMPPPAQAEAPEPKAPAEPPPAKKAPAKKAPAKKARGIRRVPAP